MTEPEKLLEFAWDVYYKAITLQSVDDTKVIDFDEAIVKEIIKTYQNGTTKILACGCHLNETLKQINQICDIHGSWKIK